MNSQSTLPVSRGEEAVNSTVPSALRLEIPTQNELRIEKPSQPPAEISIFDNIGQCLPAEDADTGTQPLRVPIGRIMEACSYYEAISEPDGGVTALSTVFSNRGGYCSAVGSALEGELSVDKKVSFADPVVTTIFLSAVSESSTDEQFPIPSLVETTTTAEATSPALSAPGVNHRAQIPTPAGTRMYAVVVARMSQGEVTPEIAHGTHLTIEKANEHVRRSAREYSVRHPHATETKSKKEDGRLAWQYRDQDGDGRIFEIQIVMATLRRLPLGTPAPANLISSTRYRAFVRRR